MVRDKLNLESGGFCISIITGVVVLAIQNVHVCETVARENLCSALGW